MASVTRLPNGKWQVRYWGPDGRQHKRNLRTEREAKRYAATVETDKLRGEWVSPRFGKTPFGQYAAGWLETKGNLRPRTLINIEARVRNHILPTFGSRPIAGIRPSDVRAWIASLAAQGLAPDTIKAIYLTLGQVIHSAQIDGYLSRSPLMGTKEALPPTLSHQEMLFLSPGEVRSLAEAIDGRFRAAVYTATYLGLREGELWGLHVRDVNLLKRRLDVRRSLFELRKDVRLPAGFVEVRPGIVIGPTKTGRRRSLDLPTSIVGILERHMAEYPPTADNLIFTAAEGGPVRHHNFYRRHFKPAVATAGLPLALRFHDLRHSCAAMLIAGGHHMEAVKEYLGHSTIRVTSDRYGHLFASVREALRRDLDRMFKEATGRPGA